ncbi:uncharacterized protein LOC120359749 [Solenopsis invicta]|uniref:uncharacterized protein LOC120359749 n=1 Tax=Solenopsis invicta TaxID=13686 RepID=UPI00193E5A65|nr:uncharacterized protein LOC120359749 [Solenopsis invicta]
MFNLSILQRVKRRKKWLFHARDFYSLMYLNFTFCKIFGIFPYKLKTSTFEISKSRCVVLIIITCAICVYELIMFYKVNFSEKIRLEVPKIIMYNFHFLLGVITVVVWCVLSGPRMRLLQRIQDISSILSSESYQRLSKLIHAKDILGILCILWPILTKFLNTSDMVVSTSFEPLRFYIAIIAFQIDMLYMNCTCVLMAYFKEINNNLENLRKFIVNDVFKLIVFKSYHEQRILLTKLKALKKRHLMVSDIVQMLNLTFSLQLLITIAMAFKQITFFLYFHIVQWQDGITISLNNKNNDLFLSQLIYYVVKITLIVWACEIGKNQAAKICTTVHDVLNITTDKQIKHELRLFSLQILHCENTFSPKGLAVDAKLFTTMINTITTYLLILIQFLGASHSCDRKFETDVTKAI